MSNVVLYDKEPSGVASVKFTDADAARACVKVYISKSALHRYSLPFPPFFFFSFFIIAYLWLVSFYVFGNFFPSPFPPFRPSTPENLPCNLEVEAYQVLALTL